MYAVCMCSLAVPPPHMSLVLLEVSSYSKRVFLASVAGWGVRLWVSVKRLAVMLIVRDAIQMKLNISVTNNIQNYQ